MKFRTEIEAKKQGIEITHHCKLVMLGSCFAQNIGQRLEDAKFDITLNPFGVLYNPMSIAKALTLLIERKEFTTDDLFFDKGLYHSFYHHSSFSHTDKAACLTIINKELQKATKAIFEANTLLVTFGTSYVYEYIETSEVVGNCHKLPASDFKRYRLSVEGIVKTWSDLIQKLHGINPELKIIFTVSPIRHLRDGAHDNQLSKATLLLAIDSICQSVKDASYFPSYEIVLDDLRDYRFYDSDMVHPNELAIEYIWNIFSETYFSEKTQAIIKEWIKLKKAIDHKPFNRGTGEHIHFLKQTLLKLKEFSRKYPFICLSSDINHLEEQIQLAKK